MRRSRSRTRRSRGAAEETPAVVSEAAFQRWRREASKGQQHQIEQVQRAIGCRVFAKSLLRESATSQRSRMWRVTRIQTINSWRWPRTTTTTPGAEIGSSVALAIWHGQSPKRPSPIEPSAAWIGRQRPSFRENYQRERQRQSADEKGTLARRAPPRQ